MISNFQNNRRGLAARRGYTLVASRRELRGLEPIGVIASRIPKYLDDRSREGEERFKLKFGLMFGVAEVTLGLFAVLCLVGLVSIGLFYGGQ